MPKYYQTVEKPENMEKPWSDPPTYGFALQKDAERLRPGDMIVDYVSREWGGYVSVLKVGEWSPGVACRKDPALGSTGRAFPYRVRVEVLCEINDPRLAVKWKDMRPLLDWCEGMTQAQANPALLLSLRKITEHDFNVVSAEVCRRSGSRVCHV